MTAMLGSALPLWTTSLLLLGGWASLMSPSEASGTNATLSPGPCGSVSRPVDPLSEDDDDDFTSDPGWSTTPSGGAVMLCDYNMCREGQQPCACLAARTGCLCPGITLDDVAPEPPTLTTLSTEGSQAVVRWCAPYSHVNSYSVRVGGEERGPFGEARRSAALGELRLGADVCVWATNDAGASRESCAVYQPREDNVPLKAGLIGGALGLVLLLLLAVLLWKYTLRRRSGARISTQDRVTLDVL